MNELRLALTELTNLHRELLDISVEKTEWIKAGNIDNLQQTLVNERQLVRKIEKVEKIRTRLVNNWVEAEGMTEPNPTITFILEQMINETDKRELEEVAIGLTKVITELKAQEKLNLALINQSMQFVHMSLDLMSPSLKNMNYSNTDKPSTEQPNRSIFDSKA
ncbi:flagellar protein FlgN [Oceanobacillus alkalisoli]|uniref:flagellar protein FlgN n=1 Tax=Oceanobacillus alkalisoli TaxID=2925113 RepID=UPI001F11DD6B|nr:flagellar protein FlgN [Oceanobacillus alkalisoli]MCF3943440.1 flagellar protein FlgN [Oceanobacillus alkalisoli]